MRLTREENPDEIRKYEHIKPAPTFGPVRCFAKFPGGIQTCTLSKEHEGPHVAHGGWWGKKVYAVWDGESAGAMGTQRIDIKIVPDVLGEGINTRVEAMGGSNFDRFREICVIEDRPWQWEAAAMTLAALYMVLSTTDRLTEQAEELMMAALEGVIDGEWADNIQVAARVVVGERIPNYYAAMQSPTPFHAGLSEDPVNAMLLYELASEEVLSFWSPIIESWEIH